MKKINRICYGIAFVLTFTAFWLFTIYCTILVLHGGADMSSDSSILAIYGLARMVVIGLPAAATMLVAFFALVFSLINIKAQDSSAELWSRVMVCTNVVMIVLVCVFGALL